MARKQLFRYKSALSDFKLVLSLEDNREAKRELDSIQRLIDSKALVEIKAIERKTDFQSTKPLTKIKIIDINDKSNQFALKLPENVPQNYLQFECDWRQLSDDQCRHLRPEYLQMIGRERIETILTSTLEPGIISSVLAATSDLEDPLLIHAILKQITKTPRFSTLVLFLTNEDKEVLNKILDKLRDNRFDDKSIKEIEVIYRMDLLE